MANGFFSSWALWEKMTFVLACGIVITVIAGGIKVFINHWKLRKYSRLPSSGGQGPDELAAEIPFTKDIEAQGSHSIPFGVRAIESGIEVEGVWISRSNSPASQDSRASSPAIGKYDVAIHKDADSTSNLVQPKPMRPSTRPSYPSSLSSVTAASDTVVESEKHSSRASSIYMDVNKHKTHRISKASFVQEHVRGRNLPSDLSFLDHIAPDFKSSESCDLEVSKARSSHTLEDAKDVRQNGTRYLSQPSITLEKMSQTQHLGTSSLPATHEDSELGLLDRHRLSQAASMGELTPRSRISSFEDQSMNTHHRSTGGCSTGYFDQTVPIGSENSSTSQLHTHRSAYEQLDKTSKKSVDKDMADNDACLETPFIQPSSQQTPPQSSNEHSHMLRRVNSGFMVLKSVIAKSEKERVSLNEYVEHEKISKEIKYLPERLPRKLQKKAKKAALRKSYVRSE